jgi:hypothetical protein
MNATTVSEITYQDAAEYLRITELSASDQATLTAMIGVAKTFIQGYTGQSDLDQFQDFIIVVLVLVQDMWDNRTLYVDGEGLNFVIEAILGMHSINLLPSVVSDDE